MTTENGKIEGDFDVTTELQMNGMFTGHVTVKDGGFLKLYGMAAQSLIVEEGAVAEIFGMVAGNVIDKGGKIDIAGQVVGQIIKQTD